MTKLQVPREVAMKNLRNTERRLPTACIYCTYQKEIKKLEIARYTTKIDSCETDTSEESWFLPYHMVRHNCNDQIVFNCSLQLSGQSLNNYLLPGPATKEEACSLVTKLRAILATGGFEIHQWASNRPAVIRNLPREAKSDSSERWVSKTHGDAQEMTLGISWHFMEDTLHYQLCPVAPSKTTMRNIYKILASQ